jgi:uncharacterized protein RhaS with RHS repeats
MSSTLVADDPPALYPTRVRDSPTNPVHGWLLKWMRAFGRRSTRDQPRLVDDRGEALAQYVTSDRVWGPANTVRYGRKTSCRTKTADPSRESKE